MPLFDANEPIDAFDTEAEKEARATLHVCLACGAALLAFLGWVLTL